MRRTAGATRELLCVLAVLAATCALLASPVLAGSGVASTGVLAGVVGLALWAWSRSGSDVATLRALSSPPTAVRARRQAAGRTAMPPDLLASFGGAPVTQAHVAAVVVPLTVLAALATHLSARLSRRRAPAPDAGAEPSAVLVARVTAALPWVLPVGVLAGGLLFPVPVALLLYWLAGSVATLAQQWVLGGSWTANRCPPRPRSAARAPRGRGPNPCRAAGRAAPTRACLTDLGARVR